MSDIVVISGSPANPSSTDALLAHASAHLRAEGHRIAELRVRDLPGGEMLAGDSSHPDLAQALDTVARSQAVVLGSPVYKASYTGLLKAFVDLLPMDAFTGRPVLPFLTGGSPAHVLALDYGLKPLAVTLGATHVADGRFVLSHAIDKHAADPNAVLIDPEAAGSVRLALEAFHAELAHRECVGALVTPAPAAQSAPRTELSEVLS
ncbi:NADPH-dependent FMN reductase [Brevibacterium samyangense]|uniref:NADPH-dependent FMN reductase-like domain-containing protein n=1 Tax=Brevibacterium samyangense TaxID=366888 RepID=A0ABN2T4J9_9MICO